MRLLIIRHGDPDYSVDNLTPRGKREAELLVERLIRERVSRVYCSPLGRARATCAPFCERTGIQPVITEWLHEFDNHVTFPDGTDSLIWNLQPEVWTNRPILYTPDWQDDPIYQTGQVIETYRDKAAGIDRLMSEYGYDRTGGFYTRREDYPEKDETVALFCHQGAGQVVLSALTGVPLIPFLHTFILPTSSVSTVFMECWDAEKRAYIAKVIGLGDISHLYAANEKMSFGGLHGTPWFGSAPRK